MVIIFGLGYEIEKASFALAVYFIVFIVYIVKVRQFDKMKELTQYFRDESGVFFKVVFTQGASITVESGRGTFSGTLRQMQAALEKTEVVERTVKETQETFPAFYYVQRYKSGIKDWNLMYGGLAKVKRLDDLALKKTGKHNCIFTCRIDGVPKKLKISNDYEGLAEELNSLKEKG